MQQENMKTLESLEDFRHFSEKELEIRFDQLKKQIVPADKTIREQAEKHWGHVAKPLGSLGVLEEDIVRAAAAQGEEVPDFSKRALLIFCADNGVVEEGVSQTGQEVTAIVAENFSRHETSACLMAEVAGVDIYPVDIGMITDVKNVTRKNEKTAYGTKNFAKEPAMTREQLWQAIETGIRIAGEKKQEGYDILLTGEMGIGNTTTSSAVASVLLNRDPAVMTGKGAGLDDDGLKRKIHVIEDAIGRYNLRQADVLTVMASVGGYDIAGLCGLCIGGARYHIPVVLDGFISGVAALCAVHLIPAVADYLIPSHVSKEPAAHYVLDELGLSPLITCDMCLGEGSGAVAVIPLLEMGLKVYGDMGTFEDIKVAQYKVL